MRAQYLRCEWGLDNTRVSEFNLTDTGENTTREDEMKRVALNNAAALAGAAVALLVTASLRAEPLYPDVAVTSHATPQVISFFKSYFTTKSDHKPVPTTDHFSEAHARVLATVPFGKGSKLMHVVGSDQGGGFEWTNDTSSVKRSIVAIDLNGASQIERFDTT